jgi:replication factor A1
MKELVDQISARLRDQKIEVPDEEIASRLKKLIDDFRVPESEARRSVLNYFLKEHGIMPQVRASSEKVKISEIKEAGKWVDLEVKVLDLWEPATEAISQTGLIGDGSGSMKFVKWAKSELPNLELGQSYLLKRMVTDEFQGRFSVKLNRTSQIEPLDVDVEIGSQAAEFSGALVDVQKGSGLIKRCPVCKRSLAKGVCSEHGKVEGTYDLRIKAVLDDGRRVQDVLINRETTERLVGLTLDEAKQMAMEALDHEVVRSLIESKLMGRYFSIIGPRVDRYLLVETINDVPPVTESRVDELMAEVEAV